MPWIKSLGFDPTKNQGFCCASLGPVWDDVTEKCVFLLNVTGQTFRGKQNINSNNIEVGYIYIYMYMYVSVKK